jgi:hypothetical protein
LHDQVHGDVELKVVCERIDTVIDISRSIIFYHGNDMFLFITCLVMQLDIDLIQCDIKNLNLTGIFFKSGNLFCAGSVQLQCSSGYNTPLSFIIMEALFNIVLPNCPFCIFNP